MILFFSATFSLFDSSLELAFSKMYQINVINSNNQSMTDNYMIIGNIRFCN